MTDRDDIYYDTLKSRDARFDGQFFTGVLTTGIFCRPICPAKTPLRKNVAFFENAVAAFEAGLRPCLRCRPETAPDSPPAWAGTSTTVKRAISLIHKGVMDDGGVEKLASSLGVGSRHLQRLFTSEVGTTPKAVADSKKLLEAKQLVSDSTLSLTDVPFASGYKSIRRFNEAYKASYGTNPSHTRRVQLGEPLNHKG
jgi:AraC family transcriptional regulator of adaptative response / DNA-3-methyladenine glycosylase II